MTEKIRLTSRQSGSIHNAQGLYIGSVGAVERQDFCKRLLESAPEYAANENLVKEFLVNRDTLSAFRYGIIAGWNSPGRNDPELRLLRDAATYLRIWTGWVLPALPKLPEQREDLPLDVDDTVPLDPV